MKQVLDSIQVSKTLKRLTHEIIERHDDLNGIVLFGIRSKGLPIAKIVKKNLEVFTGIDVPLYELDIRGYRDDDKKVPQKPVKVDIKDKNVILIDDVLYTGRSVRAALDAVVDMARPSKIEFLVLVDRGHRELPIRADYVGKNMPTSHDEVLIFDTDELAMYIKNK
ncbi:Bifunctional pyrimidine operon attenuation protein/uracil phosphoribosyltransferase [Paracholeplasma brassicae]|uniref:Bifunctional protein PyrR n=2 Tax=Acholeplasma brassicae TaxID=61635 RepID=U4KSN0_9MOLU|nr:bifunctional pyr operon transcriptional regulator/uracil phosphoribosyltransferase PyrR [Paracholeplasma brassicae]CCV65224.1 Bifunctional pyrimidine operon attenuation protein/uracil phosphoribosyltransferase [Paracholeplasma brassicae]